MVIAGDPVGEKAACQWGAGGAAPQPGRVVGTVPHGPLPQPVNLQAVSEAVSQGQVSGVLGSPEMLIYPHSSEQPVSAPARSAFGQDAGWFRWLRPGLHW